MKNLFFFTMIVLSFGCQTTSPSVQEQETIIDTLVSVNSEESPALSPTSNPGEIIFTLKILESFTTDKEICGESRKNVLKVKVMEVVKRGMGISNIPKSKDEILVNFILLPNDLEPTTRLEVKAKEFLCLDASESFFTVISHKILE